MKLEANTITALLKGDREYFHLLGSEYDPLVAMTEILGEAYMRKHMDGQTYDNINEFVGDIVSIAAEVTA
jgi:hypothetical protein